MLQLDDANLSDLLTEALRYRSRHTELSADRIRKFAGNRYRADWEVEGEFHENYGWEFVVNTLPGLFHHAPKVEVQSDFKGDPMLGWQIEIGELGVNGWLEKSNAAMILGQVAQDMLFDFGVAMVRMETMPGGGDDPAGDAPIPLAPRLYRVSPRRFLVDSTAADFEHARFVGHMWTRDMDDLLEEVDPMTGQPRFDPEAVSKCTMDHSGFDPIDPESGESDAMATRRNRVWGIDLYVRETRQILTLGMTTGPGSGAGASINVVSLCPPVQYIGPRKGPYTLFGMYWVPDQVLPLAPLAITEEEEAELNQQLGQISDDAGTAKRIIIHSGTMTDGAVIAKSANGLVLHIPGATPQTTFPIEFPGAQPANVEHSMRLMERLDRKGGLTQADRGRVSPEVTATAEAAAAAGSTRREAYQKKQFRLCACDLLEKAHWYFHESSDVQWDVLVTDQQTGQSRVMTMVGGPMPGLEALHLPYETMRLSIEPMTMEYEDDAIRQRRLEGFFAGLVNFVSLAQQGPYWKVENIIDDWAEAFNMRGAANRYIDMAMFRQFQAMQMMLGAAQAGAQIDGERAGAEQKRMPKGGGKENGAGAMNPVRERAAMLAESQRR